MRLHARFAVPLLVVVAGCAQPKTSTGTPAATPSPTRAPGAGVAAAPAGAQNAPGAPGGGRGGPPMTPEQRAARRDSIAGLRTATVQQLMQQIAGRENEPAGQVFKNVQLMKDVPAGQFVTLMDQAFGRALSTNCTSCHIPNQWASDSLGRKKSARIMIAMVNAINTEHLSKMPARGGQTPRVQCVTCHRGNGNPGVALLP